MRRKIEKKSFDFEIIVSKNTKNQIILFLFCRPTDHQMKEQKQSPAVFFKEKFLCWSLFSIKLKYLINFIKKRLQYWCFPVNIANFKNNYFEKHLGTAASDISYTLHRKLNKIIQESDWPFVSFETENHSILLTPIRIHLFYHSLSFTITYCHFLLFVAIPCHSLSLVVPLAVTRCHLFFSQFLSFAVTRCHSLYHSLSFVVTFCHSLSLDVPLVCLFIKGSILQNLQNICL